MPSASNYRARDGGEFLEIETKNDALRRRFEGDLAPDSIGDVDGVRLGAAGQGGREGQNEGGTPRQRRETTGHDGFPVSE